MSIPVISPIVISFSRGTGDRLLAAGAGGAAGAVGSFEGQTGDSHEPDYTVDSPAAPVQSRFVPDPAIAALDEIETAVAASEYHDFDWWQSRTFILRAALEQAR